MPDAGRTREPCVQRKCIFAHASDVRAAGTTGTPCAMVLRLIARSPRGTGLDSPRRPATRLAGLDPSIGGSGPHAFAVRFGITRQLMPQRPSHPAPTLVTTAKRPS